MTEWDDAVTESDGVINARAYSPDERWDRRLIMSLTELSDAAEQLLDMAGGLIGGQVVEVTGADPRVNVWLLRAQWYMLRMQTTRRQAWMQHTGVDLGSEIKPFTESHEGHVHVIGRLSDAEAKSLVDQPDHRWRRGYQPPAEFKPSTFYAKDEMVKIPLISDASIASGIPIGTTREVCSMMGGHDNHTWGDQDENWCPGKNASSWPLDRVRKVKDNPQA